MKRFRLVLMTGFIFAVIIALLPVLRNLRPTPPSQTVEAQLNPQRIQLMQPTNIIEFMNLRSGLTILDLGAGRGLFTFSLADQVGNNGQVFATDIDPQIIDFLHKTVKENGITNVFPILVQSKQFDPFYSQQTFDVILASEVVPLIPNVEEFFRQLAPSLKPESGRLWIIVLKLDPDFYPLEFGDFSKGIQILRSSEGGKFLLNRLQPELKKAIASQKGDKISESLQIRLVEDLNRLLNDHTFWTQFESQFSGDSSILNPREKQLRDYLVAQLNQAKVFNSTQPPIQDEVQLSMRLLNRLLIQDILQTTVWEEAFSLDQLWWDQWQGLLMGANKADYLLKLPNYQLVKEYDNLLYHQVWELKRSHQ